MKSVLTLLFLTTFLCGICLGAPAPAAAAAPDSKSAGTTAETFLAGYIPALNKSKNSGFVGQSKLVTPEFKATFKKAMADKELESDPVIYAQDVPITPFKTASSKVKGDTATVVVTAKYNPKETSKLKVTLVAKNGAWLITRIQQAK
jgi:predicted lipid-binding transport protein (Tim44 family)